MNYYINKPRRDNMENNLVVKHNDLIGAKYDLTLNEQKIILYAVSKLDRDMKKFNILSFGIRDFFKLLGTTQERYTEIREIIRELRKKEIIINTDERELIVGWLSSIDYIKDDGIIELEFSEKLIPYLLQLQERFTRYELKNILYFKNKHSIRIYELLKQYENIRKRNISLVELRKYLSIEKDEYKRFDNFERRVLKTTTDEINMYTDIYVTYEKIKTGRRITSILFKIKSKDQDNKIYIDYLDKEYNIKDMKRKMGLGKENFNSDQIIEIYSEAVKRLENEEEKDIFEYVRLNYLHIKDKARNKYTYLLKALENDYAAAIGQIRLDYYIENN